MSPQHDYYWDRYISLVNSTDIVATLDDQGASFAEFLRAIPESKAGFRYGPEKWSVRQVAGHIIDSERIFAYRALRFARNDRTPLPGFEQDDYVRFAPFENCSLAGLTDEFAHLRAATVAMFRQLDAEAWARTGVASGVPITVTALAWVMAGHVVHHRSVLEQKYLSA